MTGEISVTIRRSNGPFANFLKYFTRLRALCSTTRALGFAR